MRDIALFGSNKGRREAVLSALEREGHLVRWLYEHPFRANWGKLVDGASLCVVAGWPHLIDAESLSVPKHGWVNCHGGPVPRYRGGSPLNWQIIEGETHLGVSLLQMDEGLDTGPVLSSTMFLLEPHETIAHAHERANEAFAWMVTAHVWLLENDPKYARGTPQGAYPAHGEPHTWRQRNDAMGRLDPEWPAERIHNFVRALTRPYPGAWLRDASGRKVRVWETSLD